MKDLIKRYLELFNENVPMSLFHSKTDEELKVILEDCIQKNTPYVMEYEDGVNYATHFIDNPEMHVEKVKNFYINDEGHWVED